MVNLRKKKTKRVKHVPQRTCVSCRKTASKRELIRLVNTADGVAIDLTGKMSGRGIYLHQNLDCWEKGLAGSIEKGLSDKLTERDVLIIKKYMEENLLEISEETAEIKPEKS